MDTESPGWSRFKTRGSPRRIKGTVLVTPGSSKKAGIGPGFSLGPGLLRTRELFKASSPLWAIESNLSMRKTFL